MRNITEKAKIRFIFLLILLLAITKDIFPEEIKNGVIQRGDIGDEEEKIMLELNVENLVEDYEYWIEIAPVAPTKEMAEHYFVEAISQIDQDFSAVSEKVPRKSTYLDGIIRAEWNFHPFGIIDSDGKVLAEKLQEEENIIQAEVELSCGAYERNYAFSFLLKKPELSEEEKIIQEIGSGIKQQMEKEGASVIKLPEEMDGYHLNWSEKREYLTPQIILLEVFALLLLEVFKKRKEKSDEKKRLQEMERDYADIVSQLSLLLSAGMTTKQAWNRLSTQYNFKKNHKMMEEKPVYEAILRMNGRFMEGVTERIAYQKFREEIPAPCYYKLMRILLGGLEKGTSGICARLEEESRLAFEEKIFLAKKSGEEASTKMLAPMMIMLVLVMGIILLPAWIGFQG